MSYWNARHILRYTTAQTFPEQYDLQRTECLNTRKKRSTLFAWIRATVYFAIYSRETTTEFPFLTELLLFYLTGNIIGVEFSCGRHEDDVRTT